MGTIYEYCLCFQNSDKKITPRAYKSCCWNLKRNPGSAPGVTFEASRIKQNKNSRQSPALSSCRYFYLILIFRQRDVKKCSHSEHRFSASFELLDIKLGDLIHKPVRALSRGLLLLQIMNREGPISVQDLAGKSGLNRTTVYRLLETLEADGFIQPGALSSNLWHLKMGVKSLSEGYDHRDWVTQIGAPVLGKLLKQVVWPTDIAVFDGTGMVIRETTHKFSPLSLHRNMIGVRWPVLSSSLGRAFFCFSSEQTQRSILRVLKASDDPADRVARDESYVANLVKITRERGYAQSVDETSAGISSIARPVFYREQIVASINLVFFTSAMNTSTAAAKYLEDMKAAVAELEEKLIESSVVFRQQLETSAV